MTTVLGIVGGSASGKSTLAAAVVERLGPDGATLLAQDSYYRSLSHISIEEREAVNFDAPRTLELSLLANHIHELSAGRAVEVPVYDMALHTRRPVTVTVSPAAVVVVEGTLLLSEPWVGAQIDRLVFVDVEAEARLERRIRRDVADRGREEAFVRRQWAETVCIMHELWVEPAKARADLVVRGDGDLGEAAAATVDLLG